jgi:hypothetical protein
MRVLPTKNDLRLVQLTLDLLYLYTESTAGACAPVLSGEGPLLVVKGLL